MRATISPAIVRAETLRVLRGLAAYDKRERDLDGERALPGEPRFTRRASSASAPRIHAAVAKRWPVVSLGQVRSALSHLKRSGGVLVESWPAGPVLYRLLIGHPGGSANVASERELIEGGIL